MEIEHSFHRVYLHFPDYPPGLLERLDSWVWGVNPPRDTSSSLMMRV